MCYIISEVIKLKANFEKRFLAYFTDVLFALILSLIAIYVLKIKLPFLNYFLYFFTTPQIYTVIFYFIYILICFLFFKGVSIGGIIFNVRVVSENDSKMRVGQIIMRSLLQSLFPLAIFNIAYMLLYRTQISVFDACTNSKTMKIRDDA